MTETGRKIRAVRLAALDTRVRFGSDGSIYIQSPRTLGPYASSINEPLEYWAGRTPSRVFLAQRQDESADAAPGEVRVGVHRADPRGIGVRVEKMRVSAGRVIGAEQGGATAPASAPRKDSVPLDDEVGAVVDQLGVEAHNRVARRDLGRVEVPALEHVDRAGDHRFQ